VATQQFEQNREQDGADDIGFVTGVATRVEGDSERGVAPSASYRAYGKVDLSDRRWPDAEIDRAPIWCSVDLRDGNQALIEPMGIERKRRLFDRLVQMGFREIEVGFPSASQTEMDFVRGLIEEDSIPEHVTIQVLTQAREELIRSTMESIRGARRAIVHLYNSTSTLQRRVVFGRDRPGIVELATAGVKLIRELAAQMPETEVVFEYSPESFTGTELDFAIEICEAVMDVWQPSAARPMILNLPATVEMSTPNVYADQIEYFGRNIRQRDAVILSVHPHNDRGTAVAAAEMALMAGADRVEGTLFGNGERTGNVDLVTLALNMLTQGVDPGLDIGDINDLVRTVEHCNRLPVHPRHPYAGDLVFTAFSGSHQDAINKGLQAMRASASELWEVPYLPMDPAHVGRGYDALIRVNSQSGKGGVAFLLERDHGIQMPRRMQIEFQRHVQQVADATGAEIESDRLFSIFCGEYLASKGPLMLVEERCTEVSAKTGECVSVAVVECDGIRHEIEGRGNGPIEAFFGALSRHFALDVRLSDFREHALGRGADAMAIAYVELIDSSGRHGYGAGQHRSIVRASLEAVVCAMNRTLGKPDEALGDDACGDVVSGDLAGP
jgi:2-isopropylmalate synthase